MEKAYRFQVSPNPLPMSWVKFSKGSSSVGAADAAGAVNNKNDKNADNNNKPLPVFFMRFSSFSKNFVSGIPKFRFDAGRGLSGRQLEFAKIIPSFLNSIFV